MAGPSHLKTVTKFSNSHLGHRTGIYLSSCALLNDASTLYATEPPTTNCVFRGNVRSEEQDYPTCLLCCETFKVSAICGTASSGVPLTIASYPLWIQVVAFGQCRHKEICAECIFQMVTLYKNSKCPLCKAELNQVRVASA